MERITVTKKGLGKVFRGEFTPEKLLRFLSADFDGMYGADAGVWEKYTIGQHTLMVMRQFERYFAWQRLPGDIDINVFRLILALHDIGKPEAIARGDKNMQHVYTVRMVEEFFEALDFPDGYKTLAIALIQEDAIGKYIKGKEDVAVTSELIKKSAKNSGLDGQDFFSLLTIFYRVDAGSYTEDAGGFKSLDHLFIFDRKKPELKFSPEIAGKIEILQRSVG